MTRQRRPAFHAPRKAGFSLIVSARALNVDTPILSSLAQLGMRPQRIATGRRVFVIGSSTVVIICCVGAIFHDGAMFGAANWLSNFIRILISEKSLGSQTRPHIVSSPGRRRREVGATPPCR